jgi:DNA-binding response OmpR family regulator
MKNILIVDDQPENLQTIVDYFEESSLPYEINIASSGSVALTLIDKIVPDLIITDWEMPEMDGIEFIKQLRVKRQTVNVPVIMCTGAMITSEHLKTALKAGATDYIRKPVDPVELIARTSSILKINDFQKEIVNHQQARLEQKNRELTENSLFMVQNNEFQIKLIQELQSVIDNVDNNELIIKTLSQITNSLELKIKEDSWSRFEIYFDRVHSGFRKNLLKEFPDLSSTDLRLCAFLRMGMNTKDIAASIFQSAEGIKVKRSRLRKKMNLDRNDELTVFLSRF